MLRKDKLNDSPSENFTVSGGFSTQFEEACLAGFKIKRIPSTCVITIDCSEDGDAQQTIIIDKSK